MKISHSNSSVAPSFALPTLALLLALIPSGGQAQVEEAGPSTKQMLEQCVAIKTLSESYCQCAIAVSESLANNRQVFLAYVAATSNNSAKAMKFFNEIVDDHDLDKYNFSSRQEKSDYVEGKTRVFEYRLRTVCANK
ncbi:hypothetical protein [Phyllobacterium zundukense]|uniref:Uncharacterized protein n=1 Tax=Phyllobacterium zundukense TaxID=1867719 RepID=A0A2N9VQI8_9HYPH|nr:hypothetical protein [Phyllobacterium zundukense]ATU94232.1 hypothetical protein BLM14_20930 [Phyllobacterium zundukense]PIO41756.1 hypothetical protein B5P45_26880 [Phyllobacterium zundukense]